MHSKLKPLCRLRFQPFDCGPVDAVLAMPAADALSRVEFTLADRDSSWIIGEPGRGKLAALGILAARIEGTDSSPNPITTHQEEESKP